MNRRGFLALLGLMPFAKLIKTIEAEPTSINASINPMNLSASSLNPMFASGFYGQDYLFDLSKKKRTYIKKHKTFDEKRFL